MSGVTAYVSLQSVSSSPFPSVKIGTKDNSYTSLSNIDLDGLLNQEHEVGGVKRFIDQIVVRDENKVIKTIKVKRLVNIKEIKRELEEFNPSSKIKWGVVALVLLSVTAAAYVKRDLLQSGLAKLTS